MISFNLKTPVWLLLIALCSCATLDKTDIRNLDRLPFEPLKLEPGMETNEIRLDLIRDTYDHTVNDTVTEVLDSPYHPLGFNLGNGLFYDLSDNLCLRVDYLLGVSERDCWVVRKSDNRRQRRPDLVYTYCHDSLFITYPPGRRKHYRHHLVSDREEIRVMHRNHLLYRVSFEGNTTSYGSRRRNWQTIRKADEDHYYLNRRRRDNYRLVDNRIYLDKRYIIEQSPDRRTLKVLTRGWVRDRVVYTLEKSRDKLYIYDRKFNGSKIEFTGNGIDIYRDRRFMARWNL